MFVVFEGTEGCGKSTQVALLARALESRGTSCLVTREPGGTPLAESIRTLFKSVPSHGDEPTPLAELHLVMAARAQHVETVVRPALARGRAVVCDRFLDSSHVYQGARGGVPRAVIDDAARPILAGLVPDLTIVLDVPVEIARARVDARALRPGSAIAADSTDAEDSTGASNPTGATAHAADRLDALDAATFDVLARGFVRLVDEAVPYPCGRVPLRRVIDARGTAEDVAARVIACVDALPPPGGAGTPPKGTTRA